MHEVVFLGGVTSNGWKFEFLSSKNVSNGTSMEFFLHFTVFEFMLNTPPQVHRLLWKAPFTPSLVSVCVWETNLSASRENYIGALIRLSSARVCVCVRNADSRLPPGDTDDIFKAEINQSMRIKGWRTFTMLEQQCDHYYNPRQPSSCSSCFTIYCFSQCDHFFQHFFFFFLVLFKIKDSPFWSSRVVWSNKLNQAQVRNQM